MVSAQNPNWLFPWKKLKLFLDSIPLGSISYRYPLPPIEVVANRVRLDPCGTWAYCVQLVAPCIHSELPPVYAA